MLFTFFVISTLQILRRSFIFSENIQKDIKNPYLDSVLSPIFVLYGSY